MGGFLLILYVSKKNSPRPIPHNRTGGGYERHPLIPHPDKRRDGGPLL
jgi:hypothetical protein